MVLKRYFFTLCTAAFFIGCSNPVGVDNADQSNSPEINGKIVNGLYDVAVIVKERKVYCGKVESNMSCSFGPSQHSGVTSIAFNENGYVLAALSSGDYKIGYLTLYSSGPAITWSGAVGRITSKQSADQFNSISVKLNRFNDFIFIVKDPNGLLYYTAGTITSSTSLTIRKYDIPILNSSGSQLYTTGFSLNFALGGPNQNQVILTYQKNSNTLNYTYLLSGRFYKTGLVEWFPNTTVDLGPGIMYPSVDLSETSNYGNSGKIAIMGQYHNGNSKYCFLTTGNTHPTLFYENGQILLDNNVTIMNSTNDANRKYEMGNVAISNDGLKIMTIAGEVYKLFNYYLYRQAWTINPVSAILSKLYTSRTTEGSDIMWYDTKIDF